MKWIIGLGVGAVLVSIPQIALACPQCAGRDNGGVMAGVMIGSMMGFPFVVAGLVYKLIRRL